MGAGCFLGLSACAGVGPITPASEAAAPSVNTYTKPERSGLRALAQFPREDSVCIYLDSSARTKPFESEDTLLIACPKHERGAIGDNIAQVEAKVVANAKHWTLLSVPVKGTRSRRFSVPAESLAITGDRFPGPWDICVLLDPGFFTEQFGSEGHVLIACPKEETGVIKDRETQQGAQRVVGLGEWVFLRVPLAQTE